MALSRTTWRKLSVQEIHELWDNHRFDKVLDQVVRAYKAGATFRFGVDKLKRGYRLTINEMVQGIYLRPDTEAVKQGEHLALVAVVPDQQLTETFEQRSEDCLICYVSPASFTRFCDEAEQVFDEYYFRGFCFRMIPDLWFADLTLVQFIREQLLSRPPLKRWLEFDPRAMPGVDGFALSPKFNR